MKGFLKFGFIYVALIAVLVVLWVVDVIEVMIEELK